MGTEISYKPPLEAIRTTDWQPQAPAIGPYTTPEQVPQLPPSGHGYEPTQTTISEEPTLDLKGTMPELEPVEAPDVMLPEDIGIKEAPVTIPSTEGVEEIEKVELSEFGEPLKMKSIQTEPSEPGPIPEPETPEKDLDQQLEKLGILPEEVEELEEISSEQELE